MFFWTLLHGTQTPSCEKAQGAMWEDQLETDGGYWPPGSSQTPSQHQLPSCEAILDFPAFPKPWLTPREAEECCGQLSES